MMRQVPLSGPDHRYLAVGHTYCANGWSDILPAGGFIYSELHSGSYRSEVEID